MEIPNYFLWQEPLLIETKACSEIIKRGICGEKFIEIISEVQSSLLWDIFFNIRRIVSKENNDWKNSCF